MRHVNKPGEHGTLTLYVVKYDDGPNSGFPDSTQKVWAYDKDHAIEQWQDQDDTGWRLLSVKPVLLA